MPTLSFDDPRGRRWTAWSVLPQEDPESIRSRIGYPAGLEQGWLVFDCGEERRRLAPIPDAWDEGTPEELWQLCQAAIPKQAYPRPK